MWFCKRSYTRILTTYIYPHFNESVTRIHTNLNRLCLFCKKGSSTSLKYEGDYKTL